MVLVLPPEGPMPFVEALLYVALCGGSVIMALWWHPHLRANLVNARSKSARALRQAVHAAPWTAMVLSGTAGALSAIFFLWW